MSYSDCDLASFFDVREPVAKKQYFCCECSAPILAGEKYTYCLGKWDDFQIYKQHMICADACRYIRDQFEGGECIAFGSLMEWYHDSCANGYMNKKYPKNREIRGMMAKILKRERSVQKNNG